MKQLLTLLCAVLAVVLVTACAPAGDTTVVDTGAGAAQDRQEDRERPTQTTVNIIEDDDEPVVIQPNTTNTTVIITRPVQPAAPTQTVTVIDWEEGEEQENEDIARAFIESSSTYQYDGSNLDLVDSEKTGTNPPLLIYDFEYMSAYEGYGDRSGEVNTEQDTEHEARIVIMNGKIISAIVDGIWNELTSRPVSTASDARGRGDPCGGDNDFECSGNLVCVRDSDDSDASGYCVEQA